MSHRRFCLLQRYLHFSDNAAFDPQNHECPKLVKVWPVLKHLNKKFSEKVTPERDVTIDESLMLFKGRLGWKQFIPTKRARFGTKCFMLCESISGYVWSMIIYTDKKLRPARQCAVRCSKRNENGKRIRKETRYFCPDLRRRTLHYTMLQIVPYTKRLLNCLENSKLQNSHWHKTGEWLESPLFEIDVSGKTFWKLQLYPRGEDDGEYISCYLIREDGVPEIVDFDFELRFNVESLVISKIFFKNCSFKIHHREGHDRLVSRSQIFATNAVEKDALTVRIGCRIFNRKKDEFEISYIVMLTRIEKEHIYGTEIFDDDQDIGPDCNRCIEVTPMLENEPLININLSYVEESLVMEIRPVSCKKIKYAVCKITIINNCGMGSPIEYVRSWIGEIKSDISKYRVLLPETETTAPGFKTFKAFFLRYDFAFSCGELVAKCGSDYYAYVTTQHFPLQQYFNESIKTPKIATTALEALEDVYRSGSFVDLDFKSETKTFAVHKAILCARSPILKSVMNLKSKGTKLIPSDDNVCKQLILFLYTDTVESFCLSTAGDLYAVASFLKIELLKNKCRNFIREKLDLPHVLDIFRIVSLIGGFCLKSTIENFILSHYDSVLRSMNSKTLRSTLALRREVNCQYQRLVMDAQFRKLADID
ncbi:unnamed protein product [Larinioides sclopetarius]|uniref:BTB domain-containing protein n=1 Tax=Larinioides sclopetarius TaxID=280406 RepID=A0AAV2AJQ2_9ARAC